MLIVSGIITMNPANHDKAAALVGPLVEATLAEEGNITYGFWAHPEDPGQFRVYEEWASEEAIAEHFATPHMTAFMTGMADLDVTGTEIIKHTVAESSKLM